MSALPLIVGLALFFISTAACKVHQCKSLDLLPHKARKTVRQ